MAATQTKTAPPRPRGGGFFIREVSFRSLVLSLTIAVASFWVLCALLLVALKWIDPPTTAVQTERYVQALTHGKAYEKRYKFVPMSQIAPNLQHAVVAAEDARFYEHHGFDWHAMELAAEHDMDGGKIRGGSTITQQLVKNLFLGTSRSYLRKGAEFTLVPVAELVLGKRRILELYLNIVEWGPGVYGAETASHYHYRMAAHTLSRDEAARLAAILPAPLKRRPERMDHYSEIIQERMRQMGW